MESERERIKKELERIAAIPETDRIAKIQNALRSKRYDLIPGTIKREDWKSQYIKMNVENKLAFWTGNIGRSMRWQEESGFDGMSVFDNVTFDEWQATEPYLLEYMPYIIKRLRLRAEEVYTAIEHES